MKHSVSATPFLVSSKATDRTHKVTNALSWDECAAPMEDLKAWRDSMRSLSSQTQLREVYA